MSSILSLEYILQSWQLYIYVCVAGVIVLNVWNDIVDFLALGSKDGNAVWYIEAEGCKLLQY